LKVVILAGGYGTRIRDVADDMPKPMIPIGPLPILLHIMKIYAHFGHREFVVCLGYQGSVIRDFFLNYEAYTRDLTIRFGRNGGITYHSENNESDWCITLVDTGLRSMTGARISRIRRYVQDDDFMLTYGDGVSDIDISRLVAFHKSHGRILTITGVRPPGRFGEVVAEAGGQVAEFNEKPPATAGRISGGFFVANRRLFDYLDDREDLVFEKEPLQQLARDKELMMYEHDGFWQPLDTSREFQLLNSLYAEGRAPWIR
jgi:glucose-1-phosphate cytidylyltransferase